MQEKIDALQEEYKLQVSSTSKYLAETEELKRKLANHDSEVKLLKDQLSSKQE
jgi:hypothetical protein